jgi:hypothetical protein
MERSKLGQEEPKVSKNRGNAGKGRPKGSKNKAARLKEDYIEVFYLLGGAKGFVEFLKKPGNEKHLENYYFLLVPGHILPKEKPGEEGGSGGAVFINVVDRYLSKKEDGNPA